MGFKGMTMQEIVNALQRCDENLFDASKIARLVKNRPSKEEMTKIKDFLAKKGNTASMLGEAENFVLELEKVDHLDEKLKAFETKLSFQEQLADLKTIISLIDKACTETLESKSLLKIFEYILMFGNFLNSGTSHAGVAGFKLDALDKLSLIKATDEKHTLLYFMVKFLEEKHPELLKFPDEIPHVMEVSKVAGAQLEGDVNALAKSVRDIEVAVKHVSDADIPDKEPFVEIMSKFLEHATQEVDSLKAQYERMKEHYVAVIKYFGEDATKVVPPEEFFPAIANFVTAWNQAIAESNKIREEEARKQRLAEAEAKRKAEMAKKKAATTRTTGAKEQTQSGVVDDLMGDVMAGAGFKSRRKRIGK